jgi:hypothetical protein
MRDGVQVPRIYLAQLRSGFAPEWINERAPGTRFRLCSGTAFACCLLAVASERDGVPLAVGGWPYPSLPLAGRCRLGLGFGDLPCRGVLAGVGPGARPALRTLGGRSCPTSRPTKV